MRAVVGFVVRVTNTLNLLAASRTRLAIADMHRHIFTKRCHFFWEFFPGLILQFVNPALERRAGCRKQPVPFGWSEFARERDRRELCRVQNLIRVSVADAAHNSRICERPLQSAVLSSERSLKGSQVAGEDIDPARIDCTQTLLAFQNVQGGAAFGAGFGQHQRASCKIESRQLIASRQLLTRRTPMQTASDHQMKDQPQIIFYSDTNTLADPPQL